MTAAAIAGLGAVPAGAQAEPETLSVREGQQIIDDARQALTGNDVQPPGQASDATAALGRLSAAQPDLSRGQQEEARALLARPDDPAGDEFITYTAPPEDVRFTHSAHFCVYWLVSTSDAPSLVDEDADALPDFVEAVLAEAEYVHLREHGRPLFYAPPPPDGDLGCEPTPDDGVSRTDIYISDLNDNGAFGFAAADPDQEGTSKHGYLLVDNDYGPPEVSGYDDFLPPLRITLAHEYNHLVQYGYDAASYPSGAWMWEGTAQHVAERVYPEVNHYLIFMPFWTQASEVPLTALDLKIYASGPWNDWLAARYGATTVRDAWDYLDEVRPAHHTLAAYDRAIDENGGRGFAREFSEFSAANAEWRSDMRLRDRVAYPDVERVGALAGDASSELTLDHTTFALLDVPVPNRARSLTLKVRVAGDTRAAIALVGRKGSATAGSTKTRLKYLANGGKASVSLPLPSSFDRITAVLVNADDRVNGSAESGWDWVGDRRTFAASLRSER